MIAVFVSYTLSHPLRVELYTHSQTRCIDVLISIEVCPVLIQVEGQVP
jgi:hypothetical protein